jgi:hypothetical protein
MGWPLLVPHAEPDFLCTLKKVFQLGQLIIGRGYLRAKLTIGKSGPTGKMNSPRCKPLGMPISSYIMHYAS